MPKRISAKAASLDKFSRTFGNKAHWLFNTPDTRSKLQSSARSDTNQIRNALHHDTEVSLILKRIFIIKGPRLPYEFHDLGPETAIPMKTSLPCTICLVALMTRSSNSVSCLAAHASTRQESPLHPFQQDKNAEYRLQQSTTIRHGSSKERKLSIIAHQLLKSS